MNSFSPCRRLAFSSPPLGLVGAVLMLGLGKAAWMPTACQAAGGSLTVTAIDESTEKPVVTRFELRRGGADGKLMPIRRTVPAGIGVVLDRQLQLTLPDGAYSFRTIRGPEYRIVSGNFSLERTSLDDHTIPLPRMVDMLEQGWTSGDCCVPRSADSLPLRMAAEDLHLASTLGHISPKPIAGRGSDEPIEHEPLWIRHDARHLDGLVFYGVSDDASIRDEVTSSEMLARVVGNSQIKVGVEDPFAWALPVWLASGEIDGFFVLGDWLRLDRTVTKVPGRGPETAGGAASTLSGNLAPGRWAERIYWNLLEAGFRMPPLAGSGDQGHSTPVGYNRLYVAEQARDVQTTDPTRTNRLPSSEAWWDAAWSGRSVATNGPLLRPTLGGMIPGHVFTATSGEALRLQPELNLSVRDPVEYLEVVHNGRVHYSARLDEFAEQGGVIPPLVATESGWVTIRVVTLYEKHFRAAISAPWYIEFDHRPRITTDAVEFFRDWLTDYENRLKRLPAGQLEPHVPFVRAARRFWTERADRVSRNE